MRTWFVCWTKVSDPDNGNWSIYDDKKVAELIPWMAPLIADPNFQPERFGATVVHDEDIIKVALF